MPRLFHLSLDTAVHFQSNRQSNFSGVLPPTSKKLLTLQLHALRSSSAEDGSIEGSFWRREAHVEDLPLRHSSTPNHAARTHMPIGSPTSKRNRTAPSTPPASSGVEPMRLIAAYPAEDTATNAQVQSQRKLRSSRFSDTALSWSGKDVKDLMQRLKGRVRGQKKEADVERAFSRALRLRKTPGPSPDMGQGGLFCAGFEEGRPFSLKHSGTSALSIQARRSHGRPN